jgi:AcrR family transcriptional regulator
VATEFKAAGGRPKVDPDPRVRSAILSAAHAVARNEGVRSLGIAQVLAQAQLSTRAFYRHFTSKDELVTAMFLELASAERKRLQQRMAGLDPVRAVAAWVDGRLDLALDGQVQSDLRQMSLEAQSQMSAAPALITPAYAEILRPLVDEVERGSRLGLFVDVDPQTEARSIHGVIWAGVEGQWDSGTGDLSDIRARVKRFCLRGLGVAADVIVEVVSEG